MDKIQTFEEFKAANFPHHILYEHVVSNIEPQRLKSMRIANVSESRLLEVLSNEDFEIDAEQVEDLLPNLSNISDLSTAELEELTNLVANALIEKIAQSDAQLYF